MTNAEVVRVPKFVEEAWLNLQPGTVVGVLDDSLSKIHLSKSLALPVNRVQAASNIGTNSGNIFVVYQANTDISNPKLITVTSKSCVNFLPDIRDPTYKKWLNGPRTDILSPKTSDTPPPSNVNADSRLFHYFGSAPTTTDSSPSWNYEDDDSAAANKPVKKQPANARSQPAPADCQDRMFKLFEEKGPTGLTMREILSHLQGRISNFQIRQILDVIAEPRRDRQGKRVHFILKPEFSRH